MNQPSSLPPTPQAEATCTKKDCVSVLVPTLNEQDNVELLVKAVTQACDLAHLNWELLIVDGGSTDQTRQRVNQLAKANSRVRLIESDAKRGLAGDILYGATQAKGQTIAVMDADLSHPPDVLPQLIEPVVAGTHDLAIGSRYIKGGQTPGWPWWRRCLSKGATLAAWPIVSVRDPMSGFFAVRKEKLLKLGEHASGFKIALELLAHGDDQLVVKQVPITFRDRQFGQSKLGFKQTLDYLQQMVSLAGSSASTSTALRFTLVGLLGLMVDLLIFNGLLMLSADVLPAQILGFVAATGVNYLFNARWAFASTARLGDLPSWKRYTHFFAICLLALFLRGAVLSALIESANWSPQAAILVAIVAASAVNFVGFSFFVFPTSIARSTPSIRWRVLALFSVAYACVLRVAFGPLIDLMPEEAYYWMYAQYLDFGYLDHPPMVSWLIWLSTYLFGQNELAVRLPAMLSWVVMAFFMYRLTKKLFDKTSAFRVLMLVAVLPIFFSTGLLMTPDAPLYACWAGCLFFMERALLSHKKGAWVGVGICMGLGMLSKYTMALLGPAGLAFILLDKQARRWLLRPEPYLAIMLATILFSPVIVWNAMHNWISFDFQSTRRLRDETTFSLHLLIGSGFALLTPLGLIGVIKVILPRWAGGLVGWQDGKSMDRQKVWMMCLTLLPLMVFVLFSLRHAPKLNWTGPVWLAALPLLAWEMGTWQRVRVSKWAQRGREAWAPTVVVCLLVFGGGMYYITQGLPGMGPVTKMRLPVAWEELGRLVEQIEDEVEDATGKEPLIVGLDKYGISSEIAFYDAANEDEDEDEDEDEEEMAGRHFFNKHSLMWQRWMPKQDAVGKTIVLIDFSTGEMSRPNLVRHFSRLSPVLERPIKKNGKVVANLFYRIGYNYQLIAPMPVTTQHITSPPITLQ